MPGQQCALFLVSSIAELRRSQTAQRLIRDLSLQFCESATFAGVDSMG
jgi:hypothetical protein